MSSVQEQLLFRVNVMQTGMNIQQINQLTTALKGLYSLKPPGGGTANNIFNGIITGSKSASASVDQLNTKSKALDTSLKSNTNTTNQLTGAIRNFTGVLGSTSSGVDRTRNSINGLTSGLSPLANQIRAVGTSSQDMSSRVAAASNILRTSASNMVIYTAEGRRIVTINNEIGASSSTATAGFERLRSAYAAVNTESQRYNTSANTIVGSNQRVATSSSSIVDALNRQNTAIQSNTAATERLGIANERQTQQYISMFRGVSTLSMGFLMLNQSLVDFRLNQESMADLQTRAAAAQERYNDMVERFGKESYMASQALGAWQKAERAIRYEQREMANQIQNQIFLAAMITQNILSDAIPALLKWGETSKQLTSLFGKMGAGFKSFGDMVLGRGRQVTTAMNQMTAATTALNLANGAPFINGVSNFNRGAAQMASSSKAVSTTLQELIPTIAATAASTGILGAGMDRTDRSSKSIKTSLGELHGQLDPLNERARTSSTIVRSLGDDFGKIITPLVAAGTAMDATQLATTRGTGAMIGLGGGIRAALPLISRLGIIGAIVGTTLTLYATNAFGARDAMNSLGDFIGRAIPPFKTLGETLVGVAGVLGLTGETAEQTSGHFKKASDEWNAMATTLGNGLKEMEKGWNSAGETIRKFFSDLGQSISKQLDLSGIIKAFEGMWKSVIATASTIGGNIAKALDNDPLIKWANETGKAMGEALGAPIGKALGDLVRNLSPQSGPKGQFGTEKGGTTDTQFQKTMDFERKKIEEQQAAEAEKPQFTITGFERTKYGGMTELEANTKARVEQYPYQTEQALKNSKYAGETEITPEIAAYLDRQTKLSDKNQLKYSSKEEQRLAEMDKTGTLYNQPVLAPNVNEELAFMTGPYMQNIRTQIGRSPQALRQQQTDQGRVSRVREAQTKLADMEKMPDEYQELQDLSTDDDKALTDYLYDEIVHYEKVIPLQKLSFENMQALKKIYTETEGAVKDNVAQQTAMHYALENTNYQQWLQVQGMAEQYQKYNDMRAAIHNNIGAQKVHNALLKDQGYQNALVTTGIQEQRQKYLDLQDSIFKNKGVIQEYNAQLGSQKFINDNITAGMQAQQIAFNDQRVALLQNHGALQAYAQELESGGLQQMAFMEGVQAQEQAFYDTVTAAERAQGSYQRLTTQLQEGYIQNAVWNKGLAEGRLEIANQTLALHEAAGGLMAYNEGINEGTVTQNAYIQGALEMTRATAENFVALSQSKGELEAYHDLIQAGIPQYNAYTQAVLDQKMAFEQVAESIAALRGETNAFLLGMGDAANVQNMMAEGFQKGRVGVKDFATELYQSGPAMYGYLSSLDEFSNTLGYDLPDSFELTTKSAEGLIKAFSGIPSVIKQVASESYQAGLGLLDGVIKAFEDGGKEVDEGIEEIEDKLGLDLPKSFKKGLESASLGEAFSNEMGQVIDLGITAFQNGASAWDVRSVVEEKANEWMDEWENQKVPMSTQTKEIFDKIRALIAEGPKGGKTGMIAYLEQLDALIKQATGSADPLATSIFTINQINLDPAIQTVNAYTTAIAGLSAEMKEVVKQSSGYKNAVSQGTGGFYRNVSQDKALIADIDKRRQEGQFINPAQEQAYKSAKTSVADAEKADAELASQQAGSPEAIQAQINAVTAALGALVLATQTVMAEVQATMAIGLASILTSAEQYWQLIGASASGTLLPILNGVFQSIPLNFAMSIQPIFEAANSIWQLVGATASSTLLTTLNGVFASIPLNFAMSIQPIFETANSMWQLVGATASSTLLTILNGVFAAIPLNFATSIQPIFEIANGVWQLIGATASATLLPIMTGTFLAIQASFGTTLGQMIITAGEAWTAIGEASVNMGIAVGTALLVMQAAFGTIMGQMIITATAAFTAIGTTAAQAFAVIQQTGLVAFNQITTAALAAATNINRVMNTLANAITTYFTTLATRSLAQFSRITAAATAAANSINRAMNAAVNAAISYISQLSQRSAAAFQTMANNATRAADAVRGIGQAAQQAIGQVQALANALESIPREVNTTINVGLAGPGAAYLQGGTSGQVYFEEGGNAYFADGEGGIGNRKKRRKAIVGETNDEEVIRTGLRTGTVRQETVTHMRTLSNLGLHEPEMLQVIPTKGYYAQRFKERSALGKMGSGVMGGLARILTRAGLSGIGDMFSKEKIPMFAFGVSPGANPNTASGPIIESSDGKLHLWDGRSYTPDQWNAKSDESREFLAESDDVGIKQLPRNSYLHEDYSLGNEGGSRTQYINNTSWRTGPNAGQRSDAYNADGTPNYKYGNNPSGDGGTGTGSDPDKWVPSANNDGTWSVRDENNNVVIRGFKSRQEANDYIGAHTEAKGNGLYTGPTQPGQNLQTANSTSPDAIYRTPTYTTMNSGDGGTGTGGGGTGTGGGGTGGGGTTQYPLGSYGGSVTGDRHTLGAGGEGYYKTVTGYNVPGYVQSPGHGATNSAKWTNPNMDPRTWKAVPMVDDPKLWKVVDNKGINIAAKFKSEAEANEFIQEHIYSLRYVPNDPPPGYGGGGGTGGGYDINPQTGWYRTDPDTSGKTYPKPTGMQESTTGKHIDNPETWNVTRMRDDPNKYKVVDERGETVAWGFSTPEAAQDYINYHAQRRGLPTNTIRRTGGTGGGGTGTGGGGTGGGTGTGTTYTAPSYVYNRDPNPATYEESWQGERNTTDPTKWRVTQMTQPDPSTGKYYWKVVDENGKNIAIRFNNQAQAQEYVDQHILAKQRGSFTGPLHGDETMNIPPASGGGGTGGGTSGGGTGNVPQPGQTSGTGPKWANPNPDKSTWRVVPMTDPDKQGKWKVVDDKGINIAAMFNSREDAELWLAHQKGQQTPPPSGGGTGGGGTGGGGTTTPPPSGGGGGTGGGGTGSGTPTQVVESGNVRIEQYPNGQKIFIGGKLVLDTTGGTGGTGGGGTGGTGGGQPLSNAYLAGLAGLSYNHNTSTHPGTGTGTGTGGGGGGTGTGGGGTGAVGDRVVGYNGNFNYEINNRRLKIEGGVVIENSLTASDMVAAKAAFKEATGKDLVFTGPGTGSTTGTTTGTGTGGTGTGGVGGTGGTGTNGVTQTQTITQNSSINGQGNNTNYDTMVGTNSRLQIQNGKVVTATGIFAGQQQQGGTGTGSGTVPEGQIRDTILKSMALSGGLSPFLMGLGNVPSEELQDSVNAVIDNQPDRLFPNYTGSINSAIGGGGLPPGTPGTPGTGGYFEWLKILIQAINKMLVGYADRMKVNVVNQINDTQFWKVSNDLMLKNMNRF